MHRISRRHLLATAALFGSGMAAHAGIITGKLPWEPNAGSPPQRVIAGPWHYFTWAEGAAVEALVDRIIPPDAEFAGGKDAGCATFIDRQLAGPYGHNEGLYNSPPFKKGAKVQGPQSPMGPAQQYRIVLAALDHFCRSKYGSKSFVQLPVREQDAVITQLEAGTVPLNGIDGKDFFEAFLKDVQQGFFADPIYGGNKDMVAWRMIGFPGTRYDYRDWVDRHNEKFPLPPVSLEGRAQWIERKS